MTRPHASAAATTDFSNVVALAPRLRHQPLPVRLGRHAALFAADRRSQGDVFWLKENAEFLNIVHSTQQPADDVLDVYAPIYDTIADRLADYPQYYRFLLSICLDLEDLGMPGHIGASLCNWVNDCGFVAAELSDLQRSEAERLLLRRGVGLQDSALKGRLLDFISRPETFAVPNKKAAYELTHIVFYLANYGAKTLELPASTIDSLRYAGLLAYLDQNYDLLAELCVAMIYAGQTPPAEWQGAVLAALRSAECDPVDNAAVHDDYHMYFVCNWMAGTIGRDAFRLNLPDGPAYIGMAPPPMRPLRVLADVIGDHRAKTWSCVRDIAFDQLDIEGRQILDAAERSTSDFSAFYEIFSRAARPPH